jgi:hypothetical protein
MIPIARIRRWSVLTRFVREDFGGRMCSRGMEGNGMGGG